MSEDELDKFIEKNDLQFKNYYNSLTKKQSDQINDIKRISQSVDANKRLNTKFNRNLKVNIIKDFAIPKNKNNDISDQNKMQINDKDMLYQYLDSVEQIQKQFNNVKQFQQNLNESKKRINKQIDWDMNNNEFEKKLSKIDSNINIKSDFSPQINCYSKQLSDRINNNSQLKAQERLQNDSKEAKNEETTLVNQIPQINKKSIEILKSRNKLDKNKNDLYERNQNEYKLKLERLNKDIENFNHLYEFKPTCNKNDLKWDWDSFIDQIDQKIDRKIKNIQKIKESVSNQSSEFPSINEKSIEILIKKGNIDFHQKHEQNIIDPVNRLKFQRLVDDFHHRLQDADELKSRENSLKQKKIDIEMKSCTQKPKINKHSDIISLKRVTDLEKQGRYNRDKEREIHKRQEQEKLEEKKRLEELKKKFTPQQIKEEQQKAKYRRKSSTIINAKNADMNDLLSQYRKKKEKVNSIGLN